MPTRPRTFLSSHEGGWTQDYSGPSGAFGSLQSGLLALFALPSDGHSMVATTETSQKLLKEFLVLLFKHWLT